MNVDMSATLEFRFYALVSARVRGRMNLPAQIHFSLTMTQAQFEDDGYRRELIGAELARRDLLRHGPIWHEDPPVDDVLLTRLREAIGAADDALLSLYYQHSYHFAHYHAITLDGHEFRYMDFAGGRIIKIAPHPGPWPACHDRGDARSTALAAVRPADPPT